jgi:hypothetical protein
MSRVFRFFRKVKTHVLRPYITVSKLIGGKVPGRLPI